MDAVSTAFTIKCDKLPGDVYEPYKAEVDRESLHKLPKRYELRKTDNINNIKLKKVHNGLDSA